MKNESWAIALRVMARLSAWIAFPVIAATFLGRWLDRKYDSAPWLFLATVGLAFIVSMYGLAVNALKEFKRVEREGKEEKEKDKE